MTWPPVIGPSLRATLSRYTPTWLANAPGLRRLFSILYAIALVGDELRQVAIEGQFAAYPGVGTPTANPYLAQSRGLIQGPNEPNATFAKRAIAFRAIWKQAGSAQAVAGQIQAFLVGTGSLGAGVYPVVVVVDRAGHATIANADTSISETAIGWDWDELGGWVDGEGYHTPAELGGWWSDLWIVIQDPFTHYANFSDPAWIAAWNSGDQTIDSLTPQAVVSGVETIAQALKGAHCYLRAIAWAPITGAVTGSPPELVGFDPTGYFGNASRNVAGVQTMQRTDTDSYWTPEGA